ncbi:MAG: hypothetical protein JXA11_10265 [Phycisphaerae bacterium]|nr:hypothetical protein [Phycisphaerae bacterium]
MTHRPFAPNQPVLMFDPEAFAETRDVSLRAGKAVKCPEPLLRPDRPWEGRCVVIWGSVLYDSDDDLFKMWYMTLHTHRPREQWTMLCYAESFDGMTWDKPVLNLIEWDGSTQNNIVYRGTGQIDSPTVVLDPHAQSPAERFRMMLFDKDLRQFVHFASADGKRWKETGRVVQQCNIGDRHSMMIDPDTGRWSIYHKQDQARRTIHWTSSDDLTHWMEHGEILAPDDADPPETEFYGAVVFPYHQYRLGYLEMFHVLYRRLDTRMVWVDGEGRMHRLVRGRTLLDHGEFGRWDSAWAFPGNSAPIRVGEELWIYYQGRRTLHWSAPPHGRGHLGCIGLAKLPVDRFVGLQADGNEAVITTQPFRLEGHFLTINADGTAGGIRASLLHADGSPCPGFEADRMYPLDRDATYFKLHWNGQPDLNSVRGTILRARFHLPRGSALYSIRVSDGRF